MIADHLALEVAPPPESSRLPEGRLVCPMRSLPPALPSVSLPRPSAPLVRSVQVPKGTSPTSPSARPTRATASAPVGAHTS